MKCFIVLEPANHNFKVIEAAAGRGMHVIAFHTNPLRAEGAYQAGRDAIAEIHRVESWEDQAAALAFILATVGARIIVGTYTSYEALLPLDWALRTGALLPVNSSAVLECLLDKRCVRNRLLAAGLSELSHCDPRSLNCGAWPWPGEAAFLKPATGSGSLFVSRCASVDAVEQGLKQWDEGAIAFTPIQRKHLMRSGALFLERAAEGELMSLEGWVFDGQYHALGLTSRTVLSRDNSIEMGATFPYEHPLHDAIVAKVIAIHHALAITHGATHTEVIVSPGGDIELVELNPRFAGSDILLLINLAGGCSVGDLLVDLAIGTMPAAGVAEQRCYASVQQLLAPAGTAQLLEFALDETIASEVRMFKPIGSSLASTNYQHDQIAAFMVQAPSYEDVLLAAQQVRSGARMNGILLGADANNAVELR